jgi:hypothetical protein
VASAAAAGGLAVAGAGGTAAALEESAPDDTVLVAPATAAAARGNGHERTAIAPPAAAARNAAATAPPPSPPPRVQIRPEVASASRRPLPPPRPTTEPRRSITRRLVSGLLLILIVAGVVVALLRATSGPATKHSTNHPSRPVTHRRVVAHFNPSHVTVAVLNGTGVTHLAKDVSDKLNKAGYKQGTVANAAVQTHRATIIAYLPKDRADAVQVAKALHLSQRSIQPADHAAIGMCSTSTAAGRNSCSAKVIVTVGTDLASIAAAAGSS